MTALGIDTGGLGQFLHAEASMRSVGARFILAAGRFYGRRLEEHPYGRGEQGACFENAFELALTHPELTYCEGRALSMGIVPVEHAWCVTDDGQVVDTTWSGGERDYYGVTFDIGWLEAWIAERKLYGVLANMFPKQLLEMEPSQYLAEPTPEELRAVTELQANWNR